MTPIVDRYRDARIELYKIERDRHVKVLYACESGSRAWGFASQDSDYDVRFIYTRPVSSYLGLGARRDVIDANDIPAKGDIDLSGWDIIKALLLTAKSNPQILEWLDSPIQYYAYKPFTEELADIAKEFNPRAVMHHYASMAHTQYKNYLANTGETVVYKKYLYALRPIFCVLYMNGRPDQIPPVSFTKLWEELSFNAGVRAIARPLDDLLRMKAAGIEADRQARIEPLDLFITEMIPHVRDLAKTAFDGRSPDMMRLEELSIRTIKRFHG